MRTHNIARVRAQFLSRVGHLLRGGAALPDTVSDSRKGKVQDIAEPEGGHNDAAVWRSFVEWVVRLFL